MLQAFKDFLQKAADACSSPAAVDEGSQGSHARYVRKSYLRIIAAEMASRAAYACSSMFVICAIRQMGGRSEAAVSTFDEVFPTSDGVQLQPSKTKRRQYVLCMLSPAHPRALAHSCVQCRLSQIIARRPSQFIAFQRSRVQCIAVQ